MIPNKTLLAAAAVTLAGGLAQAQVPLSGNISDSLTGPLLSGTVYHASAITVPAGETLTVQAGAIVKFTGSTIQFNVNGTLDVNGSSGSPAIFTSIQDDAAGGDTNANGASSGAAGDWRGLIFSASASASTLDWCEVRFGGSSSFPLIDLVAADISMADCVLRDGLDEALDLSSNSFPTVSDCSFLNTGDAISGVDLDAVAGFANNTATGGAADYMQITSGTLDASASISASNVLGVLVPSGAVTVPAGVTLTLGAGVVFKPSNSVVQFNINGTLDANGTSANPVVFTAFADDSIGGDTNGDGPSSGAAAAWRGLIFSDTADASTLDWCELRYGGASSFPGIDLVSADIAMADCVVRDCFDVALDLSGNSYPAITDCVFVNNDDAVVGVHINAVSGFSNNTAGGGNADYMLVSNGVLSSSLNIAADNILGGALVQNGQLTVPAGLALTLEAGVVFKPLLSGVQWSISGTLIANGSAGNPVVVTSFKDDSAGGDTNGDGASTGAPGDWRGLIFTSATSAGSNLAWFETRFTGASGFNAIDLNAADITLSDCTLRDGAGNGLDLSGNSFPTVSGCSFDNLGLAVNGVQINAVEGFSGNAGAGSSGNYMLVTDATTSADLTIAPTNILNGALVNLGAVTVSVGHTLTLDAGVVFKAQLSANQWNVSGVLNAQGTEASPIVLTSFHDDSIAGDTNQNGAATTGSGGQWRGLIFSSAADASELEWCEVRYGGISGFAGIALSGADVSLSNTTIRDGNAVGLELNGSSLPTVRDCHIDDNLGLAVGGVLIEAVPGFAFNSASGNAGNYMNLTSANVTQDLSIEDHNVLNGALVLASPLTVSGTFTLDLGPGVAFKPRLSTHQVDVASGGTLNCNGTIARPVVFTSFADDSVAGDTNFDGAATVPAPGDWRGISYFAGSTGRMTNTAVRYPGSSSFVGVDSDSLTLELDGVRVDYSLVQGFNLGNFANATRLCAFGNTGTGIVVGTGGSLTRSSAVNNGAFGFDQDAGVVVRDSLAWGNASGGFKDFGASDLFFSNGDGVPAGNGNLNSDPLFVNQAAGDLRLTASSPSVDTADPLAEVDPDCTAADMGAHFYDQGGPSTYCTAKVNSLGCTPFVDFLGQASASSPEPFTITGNDVLNNKSGLFFYGQIPFAGTFQGGTKCVASPVRRTPVQGAGGDLPPNNCSGTYVIDMNARIQSGLDTSLVPGVTVYGQFWMRDPQAPFTTGLTDGVSFPICP